MQTWGPSMPNSQNNRCDLKLIRCRFNRSEFDRDSENLQLRFQPGLLMGKDGRERSPESIELEGFGNQSFGCFLTSHRKIIVFLSVVILQFSYSLIVRIPLKISMKST